MDIFDNSLTQLPSLTRRVKNLHLQYLSFSPIIPDNIKKLYCYNNSFKELTVSENVTSLYCSRNPNLIRIHPNDNIHWLDCSNNSINHITHFPKKIYLINISENPIKTIPVIKDLSTNIVLYFHQTLLETIPLEQKVDTLFCDFIVKNLSDLFPLVRRIRLFN
jgi:Leucine-rich repeat (LRR) protein